MADGWVGAETRDEAIESVESDEIFYPGAMIRVDEEDCQ
jgi:hypothetical protein